MSYGIYFEAKLDSTDKWVSVGDDWISIPDGSSTLIREVCGSYPSDWSGKKCVDMYAVLMQGASLLSLHPNKYKPLEGGAWCSVSGTYDLLIRIADVCNEFPTAVMRVDT